ncbi:MAG: hypothetical protein ABTQ31_17285 [Rhizobiaceae bacterium]
MPKKSPHPYVVWREGRPRFVPDQRLRAAGHKGRDLRHEDGRWYSRGEAVDWSEAFVGRLAEAKRKAAVPERRVVKKPAPAAPRRYAARPAGPVSLEQLFEDWYRTPKFQLPKEPAQLRRLVAARAVYAPNTIRHYRNKADVLAEFDPSLWASPADALDQPIVFGLYEALVVERGMATARAVVAVLSVCLAWGKKRGRIEFKANKGVNPARELGMVTPPPRIRFATRPEINALVAAADALGRPEIGDMVLLGLWTGQRQSDRLELEDFGLFKKRRRFVQGKTNARVDILEAPELERRLKASAERRKAAKAEALLAAPAQERDKVEKRFRRVILNERIDSRYEKCFWQPYTRMHYSHEFGEIRAAAVKGIENGKGGWKVKPCPSLADFHEADLRDTAVTWMALADATIPQIIAVTGHTAQSANTILKHYLASHPEMADEAIGKMIAWYDADGETEMGL